MKKKLVIGLAACSVVALAGSISLAQSPPVVVMPTSQTASGTIAPPTCGGERQLKVSIEKPKDARLSTYRLVGGQAWTTDLTLIGKVTNDADSKACSATSVRFSSDEPEARASLQTCATMAAALGAGQRFYVSTKSSEPAVASPSNNPRLTVRKAIQIDCGIE